MSEPKKGFPESLKDYDPMYGRDFNECCARSVAKGFAIFCIGFSLTYIIQKRRNPQKIKNLYIFPSVIGSVIGLETIRLSIGKCRKRFI